MKDSPQVEALRNAPLDCWIALSDDETRVVGVGDTMEEAVEAAAKNGFDDPIIMRTPEDWRPRVLAA